MATARKRWFRVATKVLRKPWSNDDLAGLVRLMAYLSDRWAREGLEGDEAGYAEVSITDLMTISGKRRADVARKSAERWADIAEISVQHRGEVTVIVWHTYPEFQGIDSRSRGNPGTKNAPSAHAPAPAPAYAQKRGEKEAPDGAALSKPEEASEGEEPRRGDPDRLLHLLARQPGSEAEKRAWLEDELPVMEAEVAAGKTWAQVVRRFWAAHLRRVRDGPARVESFEERASRELRERAEKLRAEGFQ